MANRFYIPGGTEDLNDTARWSATDGGSTGAAVPVTGDDIYFKQGTSGPLLNLSVLSAVNPASVNILDGFGGTASGVAFGTDANPIVFGTITILRISNNRLRFAKISATITTADIRHMGGGKFMHTAGACTDARFGETGSFEIEDDVEYTSLRTAGMSGVIKGDATSPVDLVLRVSQGANVECWRKVHTLDVGGQVTMRNAAEGSATSGTSYWSVQSGGRLNLWQSGNIVNIEAMNGSFVSAADSPGFATAPTLTNLYGHQRATVLLPSNKITVTNKFPMGDINL